jgi:hypothetical protein
MNPYVKGFLIIFASAIGQLSATATPIVATRIPTTLDLWVVSLAVLANIAGTTLALVTQSPLPRKEWTDEERQAKIAAQTAVQPKGTA